MTENPPSSRTGESAASPAEIDVSCRLPLLILFISAAIWLVIASVFGLIASLKFHSPQFLAECPCLTYGRIRPAFTNSMLYGFCIQAGLGVALWLIARLGQATLAHRWLVSVGAKFWNLGVTVGVIGILLGDSTGFENLASRIDLHDEVVETAGSDRQCNGLVLRIAVAGGQRARVREPIK